MYCTLTLTCTPRAILHDPDTYPDPERFIPERFLKPSSPSSSDVEQVLNPDILDPKEVAFGFGRRVCPGLEMGYESMWIIVASVLAVFKIDKARDEHGNVVTPPEAFTGDFVE